MGILFKLTVFNSHLLGSFEPKYLQMNLHKNHLSYAASFCLPVGMIPCAKSRVFIK